MSAPVTALKLAETAQSALDTTYRMLQDPDQYGLTLSEIDDIVKARLAFQRILQHTDDLAELQDQMWERVNQGFFP